MEACNLTEKKCVPCEEGAPPLKPTEIRQFIVQLKSTWLVLDNKKIKRDFQFRSFREAIQFVDKVANLAEEEGHHPDIAIHYKKVTIELYTHKIDGLSENDFVLASKIELIEDKFTEQ